MTEPRIVWRRVKEGSTATRHVARAGGLTLEVVKRGKGVEARFHWEALTGNLPAAGHGKSDWFQDAKECAEAFAHGWQGTAP